jgi:hypothetical protein
LLVPGEEGGDQRGQGARVVCHSRKRTSEGDRVGRKEGGAAGRVGRTPAHRETEMPGAGQERWTSTVRVWLRWALP